MSEIQHGTPEWHELRLGRCTGSRLGDALGKLKGGKWAATRESYTLELICERLTGIFSDHYISAPMRWGTENEPLAIAAYEFLTDNKVHSLGYVAHPKIPMFGATPDGGIGDVGLLEIKCPNTKTHIQTMLAGEMPEEHMPQIMAELACTGRAWADFVSFDPRLPADMQIFRQRIHRDGQAIFAVECEVVTFLAEVSATLAKLQAAADSHRMAA